MTLHGLGANFEAGRTGRNWTAGTAVGRRAVRRFTNVRRGRHRLTMLDPVYGLAPFRASTTPTH